MSGPSHYSRSKSPSRSVHGSSGYRADSSRGYTRSGPSHNNVYLSDYDPSEDPDWSGGSHSRSRSRSGGHAHSLSQEVAPIVTRGARTKFTAQKTASGAMRFVFRRPSETEEEAPVPDPDIPDHSPEPARHSIHSMDPRYAHPQPIHSVGQSSDSLTDYRAAYYHQRQTNETL